MKAFTILFFVFLFSFFTFHLCVAQGCLPEGITFSSQGQINSFQANYPGCTIIEGDVTISDNGSGDIANLFGLSVLTSIGGNLKISINNNLYFLTGLDNLATIGGDFEIWGNKLQNLTGLEGLTSIGGDLYIHQTTLTSMEGLQNLQANTIMNINITDNPQLSDCQIQGLCDYLASPNGTVDIGWNGNGCNSVVEVGSACGGALPCLPYGNYYLLSQDDVDNFATVFPACNQLEGLVRILNSITNLNGLNSITSINGGCEIYSTTLSNFEGLNSLSKIAGDFTIHFNPVLVNMIGLESLDSIGGSFAFRSNDSLEDLEGLNRLKHIGGNLNAGVETYWGSGNPVLTSLSGLDSLATIGGSLEIYANTMLSDISGLKYLKPGSIDNLKINYNANLSSCAVKSICDYLKSPDGTAEIHDNAQGCNSREEVEEECLTDVADQSAAGSRRSAVIVYPNPFRSSLEFRVSGIEFQKVSLKIYNAQGQEVAVVLNEKLQEGEHTVRWDAGALPAGVYYFRLSIVDGRWSMGGKIVKY